MDHDLVQLQQRIMMHLLLQLLFLSTALVAKSQSDQLKETRENQKQRQIAALPPPKSTLEVLLQQQIKGARCAALCATLEDVEGASQCREVCFSLTASSSSQPSSICSSSNKVCRLGCQRACQPPLPPDHLATLTSLSTSSSLITWHLNSSQPAVFLVAGKDVGGKWHLLATTINSSVRTNNVNGFTTLRLLAVVSAGIADRKDFKVNLEKMGEKEESKTEGSASDVDEENAEEKSEAKEDKEHYIFNFNVKLHGLSFLALPGCLALLLLFLLIIIERMCTLGKRNKRRARQGHDNIGVIDTDTDNVKMDSVPESAEKKQKLIESVPPSYKEAMATLESVVVNKKVEENTKNPKEMKNGLTKGQKTLGNGSLSSRGAHSPKIPDFNTTSDPSTPVFSIVTITWPTAVDNIYEEVENPFALRSSNSFVRR